jgi:lipoprotein-releasing system ATP-binding protein
MFVELHNVAKRYESPADGIAVEVLGDVNLQIAEGESVAIVGPSGSGKSTLLNLIGALDRPTAGRVLLDGEDLSGLTDNQLAELRNRKIGFVFQLHHLLPQCTILENVLLPAMANPSANNDETLQRAERLLERVGLKPRRLYRPGRLSGGERQRAAVVRALINRPKLLLADEPTGSLDRASAENLGQLLVDLNREEGVALVVVTHSAELAKRMARVLELRDGRLAKL